jgi:hypothetical protein
VTGRANEVVACRRRDALGDLDSRADAGLPALRRVDGCGFALLCVCDNGRALVFGRCRRQPALGVGVNR